MITDKGKSKIKRYICKAPIFCHLELVERPYGDLVKYDNHVKLVAESAEQARKEAAERLCRSCPGCDYYNGGDIGDNCVLRNAILGDSVVKENLTTDHITDTGEKLAIAVKALEYVASKSLPSSAFESHYSRLQDACAKASDALKEIQG